MSSCLACGRVQPADEKWVKGDLIEADGVELGDAEPVIVCPQCMPPLDFSQALYVDDVEYDEYEESLGEWAWHLPEVDDA